MWQTEMEQKKCAQACQNGGPGVGETSKPIHAKHRCMRSFIANPPVVGQTDPAG